MDGNILYSIIYALAASGGREAALFGECAPLAREAFARSLAGDYFPELWFELPFIEEPWFDLHALVEREDLDPNATFSPDTCGGVPPEQADSSIANAIRPGMIRCFRFIASPHIS